MIIIKARSKQTRTRIGSAKYKAPKPMKAKAPKKRAPPKVDRQKKKNCHEQAFAAWLKTLPRNRRTGEYDYAMGINMPWPDYWNRWVRQHPECR
ncbi:MAG: hypothetical protein RKO66_05440 [Candidatus Contendobacter sp.]|nr:hypothetical protein [Candidatus Contendobacter sp.]MDS4058221.1 hypothetical protein [Candidatus Contendobacter sp.]